MLWGGPWDESEAKDTGGAGSPWGLPTPSTPTPIKLPLTSGVLALLTQ